MFALAGHPGGVLDDSSGTRIVGRIYEFDGEDSLLRILDDYEGYSPNLPEQSYFVRQSVDVRMDDGRILPAWIYTYNEDPGAATPIPHGDYLRWLAELTRRSE